MLSSIREGLPNVVLEAMAMDVPVIATKVAGVPRLIQDGANGLLIEPGSTQGLVDALIRLHGDAALRAHLAFSARETVERNHSFGVRMNRICTLYESCWDKISLQALTTKPWLSLEHPSEGYGQGSVLRRADPSSSMASVGQSVSLLASELSLALIDGTLSIKPLNRERCDRSRTVRRMAPRRRPGEDLTHGPGIADTRKDVKSESHHLFEACTRRSGSGGEIL